MMAPSVTDVALAAGFGEEIQARIVVEHSERRLRAAGENHSVDRRVIHERASFSSLHC